MAIEPQDLVSNFAKLEDWHPSREDKCRTSAEKVFADGLIAEDRVLAYEAYGQFQGIVAELDLLGQFGFRDVKTFSKTNSFLRVFQNNTYAEKGISKKLYSFYLIQSKKHINICVYITDRH